MKPTAAKFVILAVRSADFCIFVLVFFSLSSCWLSFRLKQCAQSQSTSSCYPRHILAIDFFFLNVVDFKMLQIGHPTF